jgi:hypothetical protein
MEHVRAWLANAGFVIVEEAEGALARGGYAYHHVLARLTAPQADDVGLLGRWTGRNRNPASGAGRLQRSQISEGAGRSGAVRQ